MPELPEVETIKLGLQKTIINKVITKFEAKDSKVVKFQPKNIENSKVKSIERRAKMLIINLNNDKSILIHLKLTGQLIWNMSDNGKIPDKFTRAIFYFNDGSRLFFNDLRRFGYIKLYSARDLENIPELKKLGPEPFSKDFSIEYLVQRAAKVKNRKVKQFIMDQEIISGIGNIYADESLFDAKILPTRKVKDIRLSEWKTLRESIIRILTLGIKYGGSSVDAYLDTFGNQGKMHQYLKVYRRTGQPCVGCSGKVERITLGGRGTHFCPKCQT